MDKGKLFSGLAIMAGLIVLGLCLPKAVKELKEAGLLVGVNMSDDDILKINDEKFSQFIDKHDINIE